MTTAELREHRYPARAAREAAGVTLEDAAAHVYLKPTTLRRYEYQGWFPLSVALILARLYGCSVNVFLPTRAAVRETRRPEKRDGRGRASVPGGGDATASQKREEAA